MSFGLSRGKTLDTAGFGLDQSDLPPFGSGRVDPRDFFDHPEHRLEIEIGSGKGKMMASSYRPASGQDTHHEWRRQTSELPR